MSTRLVLWTTTMAYVGFLIVGNGSREVTSVTASGALMGAGLGFLLASIFARRSKRRREPVSDLRRY